MPSASRGGRERLLLAASERVYRALLVVYPKGFRRAFGGEMARAFRDLCREALGRGGTGRLLGLWLRALLDLSANAFAAKEQIDCVFVELGQVGGDRCRGGRPAISRSGYRAPHYRQRWLQPSEGCGDDPGLSLGNGGYNPPRGVGMILDLVHIFGTLLVSGGLFGLARLLRRRRMLALSGSRGASWARRSGVVGLVLAALAASASVVLVVGALATGDFVRGPGSYSMAITFSWVLGLLLVFGLPLATVLLGVAAWRSGVLGRWRALPLAVGALASPLVVPLTIYEVVSLALYPHPVQFIPWARFLVHGGPDLVAGAGWALLGVVLFAGREGDEEQRPVRLG